jgi:hypothetical protein
MPRHSRGDSADGRRRGAGRRRTSHQSGARGQDADVQEHGDGGEFGARRADGHDRCAVQAHRPGGGGHGPADGRLPQQVPERDHGHRRRPRGRRGLQPAAGAAGQQRPSPVRGALQGVAEPEHHPRGGGVQRVPGQPAAGHREPDRRDQPVAGRDRVQPGPAHPAGAPEHVGPGRARVRRGSAGVLGGDHRRRGPVLGAEVPASGAADRAFPRPRGPDHAG